MNLLTQETRPHSEDIRLIPLTQGQFAIVDADDFEWLTHIKWFAHWSHTSKSFYAASNAYTRNERGHYVQKSLQMGRVLLLLDFGDKRHADHINHNTLDNRRVNLRITDHSESMRNRGRFSSNTSGYKGVYWRGPRNGRAGYWCAAIQVGKKRRQWDCFKTPEEAYAKYCEMSKLLHGEHAWVE